MSLSISEQDCPFCQAFRTPRIVASSPLAAALFDLFPISPGHTLIVPKRHVADWFDLTEDERNDILELAAQMRERLIVERNPDGWNVGINIGAAGGQTVGHVHMHLIPRYDGDRPDPRGGVRWILPDHAAYWDK